MHAPTVTFYTLATIAGQDLSLRNQALPNLKPSTTEPTFSSVVLNNTITSTLTKQIAPPERLEMQPSRQVAQSRLIAKPIILTDVHNHRAQGFIEALAARRIIQGFPDGTFRPDQPVTRAQFAAMIQSAFSPHRRAAVKFVDVPANHWAYTAIQDAAEMGFLAGYPGHVFNPNQYMPRVQALVSLAKGLKLPSTGTLKVLKNHFQDTTNIPDYARDSVAAAIESRIVYPDSANLKPYQVATRGDVAVFIYQALVSIGELPPLDSSAIASQ